MPQSAAKWYSFITWYSFNKAFMKVAKLLHNPGAGDEDHKEQELISIIEDCGFECRYSSTKDKDWKDIEAETDFLVVGGGDGTIRRITKELLDRKKLDKTWPIAPLPLGTANNIAKSIGITGTAEQIIRSWKTAAIKAYDIGRVYGPSGNKFFLESFGYGIFPSLMMVMEEQPKESIDTPEKSLQTALERLHDIVLTYKARKCTLQADGSDYSGMYLLAEIMNTRSIGPNLTLAEDADPGDGELDLLLLEEKDREQFAAYVTARINGKDDRFTFRAIKCKNIEIAWDNTHVHVDDEIVKLKKSEPVRIELLPDVLKFLVPGSS
jgi:diacylglycerol kinase family enzyme